MAILHEDPLDTALMALAHREMRQAATLANALDTIMDNGARRTRPRSQKIHPGDLVVKEGRQGRAVSTDEGFAQVHWEYGVISREDFRLIEVVHAR